MARFDWYQATVEAEVREVLAALPEVCDGFARWDQMPKAPHGYRFGQRLHDMEGPVCQVWWGGAGAQELPHVVFSGEVARVGCELLRARFPHHRVTRADACVDYAEPGAYDRLQDLALTVARDRGITVDTRGDHLVTKQGRTLYLGAASSHTRLRLYDKAAELRVKFQRDPVRLAEVPRDLARLECQVRPQTRESRELAARVEPMVLMGSAAWMRALMGMVAGVDLEPFEAGKVWRQTDDDRAYAALLAQYGGLLERRAELHGSFECLGKQIEYDLGERRKAVRRGK